MESVYSSPDYMRTRKKENSAEGDDIISVSSSTCASSVNGTYTPKGNTTIKNRTNNKKILKNVRSIQRRVKSRTSQPSNDYLLHEYNASPNYLKATSCSEGKKSNSQSSYRYSGSIFDSSEQNSSHSSHKSIQPQVRNVRILLKKASFKPKRPSSNYSRVSKDVSEDVPVDRATYSSTLKDCKFPKPMNLHRESEGISAMKVCRYQHCSLHGHCHAAHDSVPLSKRFVYKKRWPLKKQNSMSRKSESVPRNKKKNLISGVESKNDNDFYTEICEKSDIGGFEDGYYNLKESEFVEIAFGETSFPERSYEESLNILRKYSLLKQELERIASGLNGYCLKCSCSIREQITDLASSLDNGYGHEIPKNGNARFPNTPPFEESEIVDEESYKNEGFDKDFPITPVIFDNVTKNNNAFSSDSVSKSTSENNSEVDGEFVTESTPLVKFKESEETLVKDNEGGKLEFSKQRHISMWHLIHHRMSSDLATVLNKPNEGADGENQVNESSVLDIGTESNDGSEIQEIEIRKLFAIKLVREAIEKILLPEVQDQTSDDQSITSENSPRPEIIEKNHSDACIQESHGKSDADKREANVLVAEVDSCPDTVKTEKSYLRKSEKKALKHWSNLKKWILLQRFIKELEKVRKFNPKKPHILPLNPDPEAEKVKLRAQSVDERKKSEEWMLDYALRQAVSQLAPTQKRKVALLVKAFETVAPSEEDPQIQFKIHKIEDNTKDEKFGEINVIEKLKNLKSVEPEESVVGNEKKVISERQNHIKMWHTIYQHVVSCIAEKVGSKLLDESDEEELGDNKSLVINSGDLGNSNEPSTEDHASTNQKSAFTKTDALKLVKEAVDEILLPETSDESLNRQGKVEEEQISRNEVEPQKAKNWRKLKKLLLLKRSIKALENARKLKPKFGSLLPQISDLEPGKIDLKNQMMDERKKAEEWMVDYAVQHIVTKLTPARKRRVAMLVEAFEAVVPLP